MACETYRCASRSRLLGTHQFLKMDLGTRPCCAAISAVNRYRGFRRPASRSAACGAPIRESSRPGGCRTAFGLPGGSRGPSRGPRPFACPVGCGSSRSRLLGRCWRVRSLPRGASFASFSRRAERSRSRRGGGSRAPGRSRGCCLPIFCCTRRVSSGGRGCGNPGPGPPRSRCQELPLADGLGSLSGRFCWSDGSGRWEPLVDGDRRGSRCGGISRPSGPDSADWPYRDTADVSPRDRWRVFVRLT